MWVGNLRGQVKSEGVVPLDVLVTYLDRSRVALFYEILLEHGVDNRIDVLIDRLK